MFLTICYFLHLFFLSYHDAICSGRYTYLLINVVHSGNLQNQIPLLVIFEERNLVEKRPLDVPFLQRINIYVPLYHNTLDIIVAYAKKVSKTLVSAPGIPA